MPYRRPAFNRLDAFLAVAEAGGFTAAAKRLDLGKNALSQQVALLERELGVALFTRTTRRVVLTEAGQRLQQACARPLRQLDEAIAGFAGDARRPVGTLRITAPLDFSASLLGPALAGFARLHPQLRIELVADNEVLDLVQARIDLAVRVGWLRDSSQRAVRIGRFSQQVVAAPAYLEHAGTPRHPSELGRHDWIELTLLRNPLLWRFTADDGTRCQVRTRAALRANSPEGVLGLLRGGGGISVLTGYAAMHDLRSGALRAILPGWRLPEGGIYLTWPGGAQAPAKVRACIDHLRDWASAGGNGLLSPG